MDIFVYSDESGVFDKVHNDIFVFGGLIILGKDSKDEWTRRYSAAEKILRKSKKVGKDFELKATNITNKEKGKLFRSLNGCYKFGTIVYQERIYDRIFLSKKDKQRYLDYVYKIAVKKALENLIEIGIIIPDIVNNIYFSVDEHKTATNGKYELRESLEQELKNGTYNFDYSIFYEPLFKNVSVVNLNFCNSQNILLVRAADIVANRIFYFAKNHMENRLTEIQNLHITKFPSN